MLLIQNFVLIATSFIQICIVSYLLSCLADHFLKLMLELLKSYFRNFIAKQFVVPHKDTRVVRYGFCMNVNLCLKFANLLVYTFAERIEPFRGRNDFTNTLLLPTFLLYFSHFICSINIMSGLFMVARIFICLLCRYRERLLDSLQNFCF